MSKTAQTQYLIEETGLTTDKTLFLMYHISVNTPYMPSF